MSGRGRGSGRGGSGGRGGGRGGGFRPPFRPGYRPTYYYPQTYLTYPATYYYYTQPIFSVDDLPDLSQVYYGAILSAVSGGAGPFAPTHYIGAQKADVRLANGAKVQVDLSLLFAGQCAPQFMFRRTERTGIYEVAPVSGCKLVYKTAQECQNCANSGVPPMIPYQALPSMRGFF